MQVNRRTERRWKRAIAGAFALRHIFGAVRQRRCPYLNPLEPILRIVPERLALHHGRMVAVG